MSFVVTPACVGCGACIATCPETAFRVGTGVPATLVVLDERCNDCGECAEVCPVDACRPADLDRSGAARWIPA